MKTRKSITKRIRITKTGKVLRRVSGQNHLKSKKSGKVKIQKRKWINVSVPEAKKIKKILAGH